MRILHLSDFHFSKDLIDDVPNFLLPALKKDFEQFDEEVDLIVISGDLIDKGGISFGDIETGLKEVEDRFFLPLLDMFGLGRDRLFFVPGNHDIERDKDRKFIEKGLKEDLKSNDDVNEFMKSCRNGDQIGVERIQKIKEYEALFYKDESLNSHHSVFESCFQVEIRDKKIGVCCLNSSWRCYGEKDRGALILGESQFHEASKFLGECDLKIAISHHPLDWFVDFENDQNKDLLRDGFDLFFCGHVHSGNTEMISGNYGSLVVSRASATLTNLRDDSRRFSNGYTMLNISEEKVSFNYRRYKHPSRFVLNTDVGNEGYDEFYLNNDKKDHKRLVYKGVKKFVKEWMNRDVLKLDENIRELELIGELVVPPVVSSEKEDKRKISALRSAGNDEENVFSAKELLEESKTVLLKGESQCGKSTYLIYLMDYIVDNLNDVIPVYINYSQVDHRGRDPFGKNVRVALESYKLDEHDSEDLNFCFLIDDFAIGNIKRDKKFHEFLQKFNDAKLVFVMRNDDQGSENFFEKNSFLTLYILSFFQKANL